MQSQLLLKIQNQCVRKFVGNGGYDMHDNADKG